MEFSYFLHMIKCEVLHGFNSKNDMGTSELRFIFGQDLSEASWKCARNFSKNSLWENMNILDQR